MRFLSLALAALSFATTAHAKEWLVENFEADKPLIVYWGTVFNDNGLGSSMSPSPFVPSKGGSDLSPLQAAHVSGHLGPNRAPYSWAQMQMALAAESRPVDLRGYKSIRFMLKGPKGGRVRVKIPRAAVKNFDDFATTVPVPEQWTAFDLPLSSFAQQGWGEKVPEGFNDALRVNFEAADFDSDFDFWVDDVRFSEDEAKVAPKPYDTTGWFPYPGFDPVLRRGTALDSSRQLSGPAGSQGWVQPKDGRFSYSVSGKEARFFGINLVAGCNFPTHEQADRLAETLAEMGVNITRHHHADAPWATHNFFGKKEGTRALDAESMDRFDYLIAQLQKRGIYQYFDLLVHRPALAADGVQSTDDVVNGWKIEAQFDPTLIALQEEFVKALLGHKNPYTGKAYGQDPGVAMMEIINEDSLLYRRGDNGEFSIKSSYYRGVYQKLYNEWLSKRYKDRKGLATAWGSALAAEEDPIQGSVSFQAGWRPEDMAGVAKARLADAWAFDLDLSKAYYGRIAALVRSLGYQGSVTGSNHWVGHPADLAVNARLGYVDRHAYWAHPQGGWDYSPTVSFDPSAMIKNPDLGIVGDLVAKRVRGLPYIATEWGSSAPNDYRADGVLSLGVAAMIQGFSAVQFSYSHTDEADFLSFTGPLASFFDVMYQPVWMALWPTVSRAYLRGDLELLKDEAFVPVSAAMIADPAAVVPISGAASFAARSGVSLEPLAEPSPKEARDKATVDGWVGAAGGQVRHNPALGILEVAAPKLAALAGFVGGSPRKAGALSVDVSTPYAVLTAGSVDSLPLESSADVLVTAGANAVNSGMALKFSGDSVAEKGTAPVLVQPVLGKMGLSVDGPRRVFALDSHGRRAKELKAKRGKDGVLWFDLNKEAASLHYEVVKP